MTAADILDAWANGLLIEKKQITRTKTQIKELFTFANYAVRQSHCKRFEITIIIKELP